MVSHLRSRIHPGLRGALFYAIYWGAVGAFEPFLNVFYLQSGLTETQIGWMAAVLPFCYLVINPLVSRTADRARRRGLFLALTCAGFGSALILLGLVGPGLTFILLLGMVGLVSVFRSPVNPLADSLIAGMASRYQLDFGHMRLWGSLTFTISAIALGAVWQRAGFSTMFLVSAAGFLPVILAALLLEEPQVQEQPRLREQPGLPQQSQQHDDQPFEDQPQPTPAASRALDPGLLCLLGATFLLLAGLFMSGTFGVVYITRLGGSAGLVGAMNGFAALGEVPGMLFGSRIARKAGDTNMLLLSYGVVAVGIAGYTLSTLPAVLLAFAVLRGIGFGALLVNTVTILNNRAPREMAATYQGILSAACWGLAPLLGGPISGWLYQSYGPLPFFLTAAVTVCAGAVLLLPTYSLWKRPAKTLATDLAQD